MRTHLAEVPEDPWQLLQHRLRVTQIHARHMVALEGVDEALGQLLRTAGSETYFPHIYQAWVATRFVQPQANSKKEGSLRVSRIVSLDRAL